MRSAFRVEIYTTHERDIDIELSEDWPIAQPENKGKAGGERYSLNGPT